MRAAARRGTAAIAGRCHPSLPAISRRLQPLPPFVARRLFFPHGGGRLAASRLLSSTADKKPDEAKPEANPSEAAADSQEKSSEEKPSESEAAADGPASGASGSGSSEEEASASQAGPTPPVVLFSAPSMDKEHDEAEQIVDRAAIGSAVGLGAALLGIAPFTAPNTFMVAMMLAAFQVRLAHTWQTRVLRAQVRRHVEEVVQVEPDKIVIKSGHGLVRTLHLNSDTAGSLERPPLSEVMRHGSPFVFMDQKLGSAKAPEALEALLASDRTISSEDLEIQKFEGESQQEADQVVQSLAKIKAKDLEVIAKAQASGGSPTPKAALGQTSRSAQAVGGVILMAGGIMCISGQQQATVLPPGAVALA